MRRILANNIGDIDGCDFSRGERPVVERRLVNVAREEKVRAAVFNLAPEKDRVRIIANRSAGVCARDADGIKVERFLFGRVVESESDMIPSADGRGERNAEEWAEP